MNRPPRSSDVKSQFDRDGFVVVRGFFDAGQVCEIQDELDRYIKQVAPDIPQGFVMYEDTDDPRTLKQLAHIGHYDAWFKRFLSAGRPVELAEVLLNGPVSLSELEWFNKPPQASRPTPVHQDGFYFKIEPKEAVTIWIALDKVDDENGCIRYVAGSHQDGLRAHQPSSVLGFSQSLVDYAPADRDREVPVHAEPGDLLVHHCLTIHSADANRSDRDRRAMAAIYYSSRVTEDVEASEAYMRSLHEDWKKAGKIKG